MTYNESKLSEFEARYTENLAKSIAKNPDEYGYPVSAVPTVIGRMMFAIRTKGIHGVNIQGAIATTGRQLCGKSTYTAIHAWLSA